MFSKLSCTFVLSEIVNRKTEHNDDCQEFQNLHFPNNYYFVSKTFMKNLNDKYIVID